MDLSAKIRAIKDFPEEGIIFRDITPLLKDGEALVETVSQFKAVLEGVEFDYIVAPESRGFIFGMPLAYELKKGFVPARKAGKLPAETRAKTYDLEYGTATIEIHADAIKKGDKVIIVDDLLATGGTSKAIVELLEDMGAEVTKLVFLIELEGLNGKAVIGNYEIASILKY